MKQRVAMLLGVLLAAEAGAMVDVRMNWVTVPGTVWYPGDSILMGYGLQNLGGDPCPGFSVRFYASFDPVITAADYELGILPGGGLGPGQSFSDAGFITLPLDLPAAGFFVGAVVTAVGDGNAANNSGYDVDPIQVRANSDLRASSLNAPVFGMYPGYSFPVRLSIVNLGPGDCDGFTVRFYASRDLVITAADLLLGVRDYDPLASGETTGGFDVYLQWPADIPTGFSYYVGAIVEYAHDPSLSNNSARSSSQIFVETRPDLEVVSIDAESGNFLPGSSISLAATVRNDGEGPCTEYTATFYASADTVVTPGDYALATYAGGMVGQGATEVISTTGVIPEDLPSGPYTVGVIVRCPTDGVMENDVGYDPIRIKVGRFADLMAREFTVETILPFYYPRRFVSIRYEVVNNGPSFCPGYLLSFHLSPDREVTALDQLLQSDAGAELGVGSSHIYQIAVQIPADTPPHTYYLGMIASYEDDPLAENNLAVATRSLMVIDEEPRIVGIRLAGPGTLEIDWMAPLGSLYALTRSSNLGDGFPVTVRGGLSPGAGIWTETVAIDGQARGFFRIEAE